MPREPFRFSDTNPGLLPEQYPVNHAYLRGDEVVHGLCDLVDHAHDVLVGPARLEEVVGLLDHLVQLLGFITLN